MDALVSVSLTRTEWFEVHGELIYVAGQSGNDRHVRDLLALAAQIREQALGE